MKYKKTDFFQDHYRLWEMGLLLPEPARASNYNIKFNVDKKKENHFCRICVKATSINDALERACYAVTYGTIYRPEDVELFAVYDDEENLLWVDEQFYNIIQKKYAFRGLERREFLLRFGATAAVVLYGLRPIRAFAKPLSINLSGTASGIVPWGEQIYSSSGGYSWTVPASVVSVCVVCVGGGGGGEGNTGVANGYSGNKMAGGGGGALSYTNSIATTPGNSITGNVGTGGLGGTVVQAKTSGTFSDFGSWVKANGGNSGVSYTTGGAGGTVVLGTGFAGGVGGVGGGTYGGGGGGGAGGYQGVGGDGAIGNGGSGGNGSGGGGGGGTGPGGSCNCGTNNPGGGAGGGVGIYGVGSSGVGGQYAATYPPTISSGGRGGSGGNNGGDGSGSGSTSGYGGGGGSYGGGGGGSGFIYWYGAGANEYIMGNGGTGSVGGVRIIWGTGRSFPSSAT